MDNEPVTNISKEEFVRGIQSLAPETRLEIFKMVIVEIYVFGTTPALVVGLPSHTNLYQEALTAFYDTCLVRFGPGRGYNSYTCFHLSEEVMQKLVRNVKIEYKV